MNNSFDYQSILQHKGPTVMDWVYFVASRDGMIGLVRRKIWTLQSEY